MGNRTRTTKNKMYVMTATTPLNVIYVARVWFAFRNPPTHTRPLNRTLSPKAARKRCCWFLNIKLYCLLAMSRIVSLSWGGRVCISVSIAFWTRAHDYLGEWIRSAVECGGAHMNHFCKTFCRNKLVNRIRMEYSSLQMGSSVRQIIIITGRMSGKFHRIDFWREYIQNSGYRWAGDLYSQTAEKSIEWRRICVNERKLVGCMRSNWGIRSDFSISTEQHPHRTYIRNLFNFQTSLCNYVREDVYSMFFHLLRLHSTHVPKVTTTQAHGIKKNFNGKENIRKHLDKENENAQPFASVEAFHWHFWGHAHSMQWPLFGFHVSPSRVIQHSGNAIHGNYFKCC